MNAGFRKKKYTYVSKEYKQQKKQNLAVNNPAIEQEEGEIIDSDEGKYFSDSPESEFNDGYEEDLMGDEADRQRLRDMSDMARESEIYRRLEQRERLRTMWEIKHRLKKIRDQTNKSKQHCINTKRFLDRQRNMERCRRGSKRGCAFVELLEKRNRKPETGPEDNLTPMKEILKAADKDTAEDNDELFEITSHKSAKLKATDVYSDESEGSESEVDTPAKLMVQRIECILQLSRLQLTRSQIMSFLYLPTFETTVKNCFVRAYIGNHLNKPVYRIAEVVGFDRATFPYNLGKTITDRMLLLRHGLQERKFRIDIISDQQFTFSEYQMWVSSCKRVKLKPPMLTLVDDKQKLITAATNFEYTERLVDEIVTEKRRLRNRTFNAARDKAVLIKDRYAAIMEGDHALCENLTNRINDLEEMKKKQPWTMLNQITYINVRNRRESVKKAEKSLLEDARIAREALTADPFTRRTTKPRLTFSDNGMVSKRFGSQMYGKMGPNGIQNKKYDPYELNNFDVILTEPYSHMSNAASKLQSNNDEESKPKKKRITLDEYRKRMKERQANSQAELK